MNKSITGIPYRKHLSVCGKHEVFNAVAKFSHPLHGYCDFCLKAMDKASKKRKPVSYSQFYFRVGSCKKFLDYDTEIFLQGAEIGGSSCTTFEKWSEYLCNSKTAHRAFIRVGSVLKELEEDTSIYTRCARCGEEITFDLGAFTRWVKNSDVDLYGTNTFCGSCDREA